MSKTTIMTALLAAAAASAAATQQLLVALVGGKAKPAAKKTPTPKPVVKPMPVVARHMPPTRQLRDYAANALSYTAEGPMGAKESDPVWMIEKIFLTDDYRVKETQKIKGSWTDRANLRWRQVFSNGN